MKHFIHVIYLAIACYGSPILASFDAIVIELNQHLVAKEAPFSDLVKGSEKHIRWHQRGLGEQPQKTPFSIVYLHGFSASRQELSPTTELVADRLGANAFYTRLTGHGRSDDAMGEAKVDAWKNDALEALRIGSQIGDKVILVSTSTGGTLATWLQTQAGSEVIVANIMISPNFGVKSSAAKIINWPLGLTIAKLINGDYNSFTPVSEKHAKFWTERYPLEAVVPMLDLVDEVKDLDKSGIGAPQLIIYSPEDKVVDIEAITDTAKEFSSAQVSVRPFTSSKDHVQHVLSGDACSPESTEDMVNLIAGYVEDDFALK